MAKARKKRKSRIASDATSRQPKFLFSLVFFLISALVFIHQCIAPFRVPSQLRHLSALRPSLIRPTDKLSTAAPRNWWTVASTRGEASPGEAESEQDALEDIPEGPLPLPVLGSENGTGSLVKAAAGSSWTGSLAQGVLSALPLHLLAEAKHAPPRKGEIAASGEGEERESIFSARRKGAWIGCERPFHLVCKGVYRAIKVTNAVRVVDVECEKDVGWLPHILHKLREEFRMVQLTCAVREKGRVEAVRKAYEDVKDVQVIVLDAYNDAFPAGTDLLVAYKFLEEGTLIEAMRFFKNVQKSGTVGVLAVETFPRAGNKPKPVAGGNAAGNLRINTALAPFWFPPCVYQYENVDENPEDVPMHICAVKMDELFREKNTPGMQDLIDPRKRLVQE